MNKYIKILLWTIVFMLFSFTPAVAQNNTVNGAKQVIVVIDKLRISDITAQTMPNLMKLQSIGSSALMNTNSLDERKPANTFITIASGQPARGGNQAGYFYESAADASDYLNDKPKKSISAEQLYLSFTGWQIDNAKIVNPWIVDILNKNNNPNKIMHIGVLGEYLNQYGISSAVIGNSDTIIPRRFAATLLMDKKGRVPDGAIGYSMVAEDSHFPYGIRTNYNNILSYTAQFLPKKDLLVVELGDLSRLEVFSPNMNISEYIKARNDSITKIDNCLGQLIPLLDFKKDQLMVLVPTPSAVDQKNNNIVTPLIIAGGQFSSDGLLTSTTTKQNGIISNLDIAPTILAFYNINKEQLDLEGRPAISKSSKNSLGYLKKLNDRLVINYNQRPPLLYTTATLEIITIILSLLVIKFIKNKYILLWFQRFSFALLTIPLLFLLFGLFRLSSFGVSVTLMILAIIFLIFFFEKIKLDYKLRFAVVSLLTTVVILTDLLTGFKLMGNSPLGYDLMVGARYYGLGNEYSGVVMGSVLLGTASLLQFFNQKFTSFKKIPLAIILLLVTYLVAAPHIGADAGGLVTSLAAFSYFMLIVNGVRISPRKIVFLIIGILVVLFGAAALDHIINGAGQSHIGKAMGQLMQGDWQAVWSIVAGKVSMNWRLTNSSIWGRVVLAVVLGLSFFTFYSKGILKTIEVKQPYMYKGIKAAIIASIVGFAVNDSGIVQAATTSIYVIFPLIFLVLKDKSESY